LISRRNGVSASVIAVTGFPAPTRLRQHYSAGGKGGLAPDLNRIWARRQNLQVSGRHSELLPPRNLLFREARKLSAESKTDW